MRPLIPPRAYYGGRGWAYAKMIVRQRPTTALMAYLNATLRGCYRPSLAAVIFLQIFLSRSAYRRLADQAISRLHAGLRKAPSSKLKRA